MPKLPVRKIAPIAAAVCGAAVAGRALLRRRGACGAGDPPDEILKDDRMEDLATDEGMPEAPAA